MLGYSWWLRRYLIFVIEKHHKDNEETLIQFIELTLLICGAHWTVIPGIVKEWH